MEKESATKIFEALSSGVRLEVFRLLVRMAKEGMVAGEIATTLDIPPTNLSFHLKAMTQVGLLTVVQEGRYQRYRANMPVMMEIIAYLTEQCCMGHPQLGVTASAMATCCEPVVTSTVGAKTRPKSRARLR